MQMMMCSAGALLQGVILVSRRGGGLPCTAPGTWAFLLGVLLMAATGLAQTATWVGTGTNASWHVASNWSPAVVPGATSDVVIPAGVGSVSINTADATVATLSVSRALMVNSGRTLTTGTATLNAAATVIGTMNATTVTVNSTLTVGGTLTVTTAAVNATITIKSGTLSGGTYTINAGGTINPTSCSSRASRASRSTGTLRTSRAMCVGTTWC